ncbi:MAG: hypothetical protein IJ371_01945, partial [Clostridia bacterium]|nr:hypothetical protein [Clostridia bacterium]
MVQKGGKTLNYTYNPDVNLKESATIAYEYVFTNSMTRATAVNLKELDTSKVNVSYAWSSSELDTSSTITTYTDYVCQTMENTGDKLYTYIFVSPKETTIPTSFTSSVMWYYGMAKEIT